MRTRQLRRIFYQAPGPILLGTPTDIPAPRRWVFQFRRQKWSRHDARTAKEATESRAGLVVENSRAARASRNRRARLGDQAGNARKGENGPGHRSARDRLGCSAYVSRKSGLRWFGPCRCLRHSRRIGQYNPLRNPDKRQRIGGSRRRRDREKTLARACARMWGRTIGKQLQSSPVIATSLAILQYRFGQCHRQQVH